jgi:hypothetical protein
MRGASNRSEKEERSKRRPESGLAPSRGHPGLRYGVPTERLTEELGEPEDSGGSLEYRR